MTAHALVHVRPPRPDQGHWRPHHADAQRVLDALMREGGWELDRFAFVTHFASGDGKGADYLFIHDDNNAIVPPEAEAFLATTNARPDVEEVLAAMQKGAGVVGGVAAIAIRIVAALDGLGAPGMDEAGKVALGVEDVSKIVEEALGGI